MKFAYVSYAFFACIKDTKVSYVIVAAPDGTDAQGRSSQNIFGGNRDEVCLGAQFNYLRG